MEMPSSKGEYKNTHLCCMKKQGNYEVPRVAIYILKKWLNCKKYFPFFFFFGLCLYFPF